MERFEQKLIGRHTAEEEKRMEQLLVDLRVMSSMNSPSGHEKEIRLYMQSELENLGCRCSVDEKGNLWVESDNEKQKRILLSAHMDKVGAGNEVIQQGDKLQGRMDDALGMSIILQLVREGMRPSMLFTVEEESQEEVMDRESGKILLRPRKLPGNIFNAGARHAAEKIDEGEFFKPDMVIIVDVTATGKLGNGPVVYHSSNTSTKSFPFPRKKIVKFARFVNRSHTGVNYAAGGANDSIEFTFVDNGNQGTAAVEIPIENMHTGNEIADANDVLKTIEMLRHVIENADELSEAIKQ